MTYVSEVLADSPVAYYRLSEASGTTAADASGNAHTGTYVNAPTLGQTGAISDGNTAAAFSSASSQHVLLDTLGTLGSNLGTSSWEFWIKTTTTAGGAIFGYAATGTTMLQVRLNLSAAGAVAVGSTAVFLRDSTNKQMTRAWANSAGNLNIYDGAWHHVVIVMTNPAANALGVYVDGVAQTTTLVTTNGGLPSGFVDFTNPMTIAAVNSGGVPGTFGNFTIDEFTCYATQLTQTRVQAHYNAAAATSVAPAKTVDPSVAPATSVHQGDTLTVTPGSYTGTPTPTVARQWKRAGADISGATGLTYVVQAADVGQQVTCVETATNTAGSVTGTSNAVTPAALPKPAVPATGRVYFGALVDTASGLSGEAGIEQRELDTGRTYDLHLHYYDWADPFPGTTEAADATHGRIPQIAWFMPILSGVLDGSQDAWITAQANRCKDYADPLFIRLGIEMNGSGYPYTYDADAGNTPANFILAWQRIIGLFQTAGATNVAFVWCPNNDSKNGTTYSDFYPGSTYVDWVGVDLYNTSAYGSDRDFNTLSAPALTYLTTLSKPIMIGECASDSTFGRKDDWIASTGAWLEAYADELNIKAFCWFDTDKSSTGRNYTVDETPAAYAAWKNLVNRAIFGGTGYAPGGAGTTIVRDSFDRADSSTPGTTDTGQAWTMVSGTAAISHNKLVATGAGTRLGYVESGIADGTIEVVDLRATTQTDGILFRYAASNTYLFFRNATGALFIADAGSPTVAATWGAGYSGDFIQILLDGPSITVKRNGKTLGTFTSTVAQTATKHGIRHAGADAIDGLRVATIPPTGDTPIMLNLSGRPSMFGGIGLAL